MCDLKNGGNPILLQHLPRSFQGRGYFAAQGQIDGLNKSDFYNL